jgi:hypothetical protein
MSKPRDHNGWKLFRIASVSVPVPTTAGGAGELDDFRFVGKICSKETGIPFDYTQVCVGDGDGQIVMMPLTFNADLVAGGDGTIDLHLTLDEENWDEAMRRSNYVSRFGNHTLVFGHRVHPHNTDAAEIE